ncbi:MAG: hypothetical protein DRN04_12950 [Thermoprotei archaeon]|nr:MAG: hypothetical protein DRN04_12950 [Thermoprotei archaeon]
MNTLEYLLVIVALTALLVAGTTTAIQQLTRTKPSFSYLKLHLLIEVAASKPYTVLETKIYIPEGVILKFTDNKVTVEGTVFEYTLIKKHDYYNIVAYATTNTIQYKVKFSNLELKGGHTYRLLLKSEPSKITIMVLDYN